MAGIPLTEIPNAPRLEGPVLIKPGGPRTTDISGATRSLLSSPMSDDGVEAMGEASEKFGKSLAGLGKSAGKVAAVLAHWSDLKISTNDVAASNQRDLAREEISSSLPGALSSVPADQRPAYIQKQMPEWRKKIATFGVSERRADQETSRQEAWERKIYEAVYESSTKQSLREATEVGMRNYFSLLSQGDYAGAEQRLFELKSTFLLSDAQYQEQQAKGAAFVKKKLSEEYLAADPRRMVRDIDESQRTGQPIDGISWTRDEARSYRQRASAVIVQREVQAGYTTHQAVLKGELDDEASIRAAGGADLSERRIASLTQLVYHDPEYDSTALTKLRTAVRGFQPGSDRDQSKYEALQEQIERTVPRAMQSAFSDELHQAWQTRGQTTAVTAQREQQAAYYRQIDSLAHKGLLGSGDDPASLGMKTEFMKAEVERFIKANPEANPAEVKEQIKNLAQQNGIQRQAAILLRNRGVAFSR